jgi:hypothetical protein
VKVPICFALLTHAARSERALPAPEAFEEAVDGAQEGLLVASREATVSQGAIGRRLLEAEDLL